MSRSLSEVRREEAARQDRKVSEVTNQPEEEPMVGVAGGDSRRLRGIPAIGRGVDGSIPGTDPLEAYLAKEEGAAA